MTDQNIPYIIVVGNEKGGTGKSTVSMHLIVSLLKLGFKVGSLDLDARQGTLSRYIENRERSNIEKNTSLLVPQHLSLLKSTHGGKEQADMEDKENFSKALDHLKSNQFLVIDTPGNDTTLSRYAHAKADTLITPINDSFIDLDMLVLLKNETLEIIKPSTYAEMVWEQKKQRAINNGRAIDWIVLRNRLSTLNARNKTQIENVMQQLSKRIGFRYFPGFCERVIFKELFLSGLTLLDLENSSSVLSFSHVAARQELRSLLQMIKLPNVKLEQAS